MSNKPNIDTLLASLSDLTKKMDALAEDNARYKSELNAAKLRRNNPSKVYETTGSKSAFWGTGIADEDIKKGTEISVTLFDSAPSRTGKQAFGFKIRKHVPQDPDAHKREGYAAGAVTGDHEGLEAPNAS